MTENINDPNAAAAIVATRNETSSRQAQNETPAHNEQHAPLFHEDEGRGFRARWEGIQTGFVDEPRTARRSFEDSPTRAGAGGFVFP